MGGVGGNRDLVESGKRLNTETTELGAQSSQRLCGRDEAIPRLFECVEGD
jgi:hypothetical protein